MNMNKQKLWMALAAAAALSNTEAATYNVLWWDSTPDYGGSAANSLRQAMSDYLDNFSGGSVFDSTYIGSETPGTLAAHLASNSYDVIVFDATSSGPKFDGADLTAVQSHYANNNRNLLFDGTLYIRSIDYNSTTVFPGPNSGPGGLLVNEVYSIASRGGGIMVGTDHAGFQSDANQIVNGIVPGAGFSGITFPSTDGVFNGTQMLNAITPVAPLDVFTHWDSVPTEGIAPTGTGLFMDFLGNPVNLYSQVDVADDPGGGPKYSYISTSWQPGDGTVIITDPNPPPGVPEAGATLGLLLAGIGGIAALRRKAG